MCSPTKEAFRETSFFTTRSPPETPILWYKTRMMFSRTCACWCIENRPLPKSLIGLPLKHTFLGRFGLNKKKGNLEIKNNVCLEKHLEETFKTDLVSPCFQKISTIDWSKIFLRRVSVYSPPFCLPPPNCPIWGSWPYQPSD